MSDIDRRLHDLAARQHGVISRQQARALGASAKVVASRVDRGTLRPLSRGVLVVAGAPATDLRDAVAATLDVRGPAALSHRSAAGYWRLGGDDVRPLEVTTPRPGRTAESGLAIVHTTTCLPESHVTVVDGLRVTVPVRVLFDLAGTIHPGRLERLVDTTWRMRLVTGRLLRRTLAELAEHGRPGIQVMRELIAVRGDDYRPTDSNLEHRFETLMAAAGIHSFERQADLGDRDWIGRVDFVDRELALVVEVDSDTFHLSLTDQADDHRRREALERAGYLVVRVRQADLWQKPQRVTRTVLEARERARAVRPLRSPTTGHGGTCPL